MEGEENERKIILSKSTFKMFVSTFLGCEAAPHFRRGSGRGVPSEKGQLGFRLRIGPGSRSQPGVAGQENGVLSALKGFVLSGGVWGRVGTICFSLALSYMKLLSGVSFLKVPLCPHLHSTDPKAGHNL